MTDLEKIRAWISTYPGTDRLQSLQIDYYQADPDNGSLSPSGLVEISRKEDILGNVTVENQYNFGLYYTLAKAPGDDTVASANAEWIMGLQIWVQDQSIRHLAPTFGDDPAHEAIKAQNGCIIAADAEGTAVYMIQLSVNFTKHYKEI